MPLDPQVKAFLDQLAAAPAMTEQTVQEARTAMRTLSVMAAPPGERATTRDISIPGPAGDIPARVYTPDGDGPFPIVVFFHGGGFVIGDIESHDSICHRLARGADALVVSVDYRLAPEAQFPAAVDDCDAAVVWMHEHASELGGDASRIAVAGDSAGGNLSAVVTLRARDRGTPRLCFQLLIYPAVDITGSFPSHVENGRGYLLTSDLIDWFMNHYIPAGTDLKQADLSPWFVEDLSALPPALVITAEFDPLRDEGEAYAERLQKAGVEARAIRYDGMTHAFYGLDAFFPASSAAIAASVDALRSAFARQPA
jgi:acetyl esterase